MKESKLFREFSGEETRHKKTIQDKRKLQGAGCKKSRGRALPLSRGEQGGGGAGGWRRRCPGGRGARVRRGKRRGDQGEHMGLLTLDGEGRREGRWRTAMVAGSGGHGRRRSNASQAMGRGGGCATRHCGARDGRGITLWCFLALI
jgi:hypothetical protein